MALRTTLALALLVGVDAFAPLARPAPTTARVPARLPAHLPAVGACSSCRQPLMRAMPVPVMSADGVVKETNVRSAVKAIGWRFTAGIVTAITSYIFTKSLAMAASIVGWDLCSKSVTMFIGERLWNNLDWGKEKGADSSKRSLAKAIAWRIFAAFNTLVGATLLNKGKVGVAGKIAGSDSIVKTVLFYFYERMWAVIDWGKVPVDDAPAAESADA